MNYFSITVPATFTFDVYASSQEEAVRKADVLLSCDPVDDEGRLAPVFLRPHLVLEDNDRLQITEDTF